MNLETLPSFNILTTGKDGVQIATVSDRDWASFVNTIVEAGHKEWYTMDIARTLYNKTGKGYFPQGVTVGKLIVVREGAKSNLTLLAHEYGHALGHEHTHAVNPDIMNPVDWMRHSDQHNLQDKFRKNFPDYTKTFISAQQNHLIVGTAIAGLGWLYFSS